MRLFFDSVSVHCENVYYYGDDSVTRTITYGFYPNSTVIKVVHGEPEEVIKTFTEVDFLSGANSNFKLKWLAVGGITDLGYRPGTFNYSTLNPIGDALVLTLIDYHSLIPKCNVIFDGRINPTYQPLKERAIKL